MNTDLNKNYEELYQSKCREFEALEQEYNEFKDLSKQFESELESEVEHLTKESQKYQKENEQYKKELRENREKYNNEIKHLEKTVEKLTLENQKLTHQLKLRNRELIQREIDHEELEKQHREAQTIISDLEFKIDKILEKLAIVQSELEENKYQSEERLERLKQQLLDTESEVYAFKKKNLTISVNSKSREDIGIFPNTDRHIDRYKSHEFDKTLTPKDLNERSDIMKDDRNGNGYGIIDNNEPIKAKSFKAQITETFFKNKKNASFENNNNLHIKENTAKESNASKSTSTSARSSQRSFFFPRNSDLDATLNQTNRDSLLAKCDNSFELMNNKFQNIKEVKQQNKGFTKSLCIITNLIRILDRKKTKPKVIDTIDQSILSYNLN